MKIKLILLLLIIVEVANSRFLEHVYAQETSALPITAIVWNPDESKVALGRSNSVIEIWDVETNQLILSMSQNSPLTFSITWSPDGKQLATSSSGYEVDVWDAKTGNLLGTLQHDDMVFSVIYSSDSKQIISVDFMSRQNLYIWDAEQRTLKERLEAGTIVAMDWSPNFQTLALASVVGGIGFREATTLKFFGYFEHPEIVDSIGSDGFDVYTVDWNPDGSQIASGSLNGKVRVWDVETGEIILDLEGNENEEVGFDTSNIRSIGFSADGERLYSISADGTIRLWNTRNGEIIRSIALSEAVSSAAFNQDSSLVAIGYESGEFAVMATQSEIE